MTTTRVALILGIVYLAAAIAGFVPGLLTAPGADAPPLKVHALHGNVFGLFAVNVLHTLVHLAIGAWGLAAGLGKVSAVTFLRVIAVFYGVLAIAGLIPGLNTLFGLLPLHGHDVWLHAGTALIAGYFGFRATSAAGDGARAA